MSTWQWTLILTLLLAWAARPSAQSTPAAQAANPLASLGEGADAGEMASVRAALLRLPLAATLGTALALRPKRRGTPTRTTAVVQTQIVLSIVGTVIMLVVGASLARAFGIVGAANLIRYRAKIDDPKDAVVMLCTLAVGLAAGVGLYWLAAFSTGFILVALLIIESFEPKALNHFELSIKTDARHDELRQKIEPLLERFHLNWELRTLAEQELSYDVGVPTDLTTDSISSAIAALDSKGGVTVEWKELKKKAKDI